jgi:hypothetical protein
VGIEGTTGADEDRAAREEDICDHHSHSLSVCGGMRRMLCADNTDVNSVD